MDQVRVGALQYWLRPVPSFAAFEAQVAGLVASAAGNRCQLLVFPEYFTLQLLSLGPARGAAQAQVQDLARWRPRFVAMLSRLAAQYRLHIAGGSIPSLGEAGRCYNDCYFFNPEGRHGVQGKLHLTRFEREQWRLTPRDRIQLFDTVLGKVAIAICYDVEFPELVRAAARAGARILIVPSCTDDRDGFLRVRYCAQARAVENQMYVVHAGTVGSLPEVAGCGLQYGQAAILTPCDGPFARDGIRAEGVANQEMMVLGDLDMATLEAARDRGPVQPLRDSGRTGLGRGPVRVFL
jgi:predicted amidohydrolase